MAGRRQKHYARSRGEVWFDRANTLFLTLLALSALYPFLYLCALSLSGPEEIAKGSLFLFPQEPNMNAYRVVLDDERIRIGFANSLFRTVFGTVLTLLATAVCAYPLSRRQMPYRKQAIFFVLFTMLFSGGLVPTYLLVKNLGLIDNRLVYILPMLLTAFNVIVLKNFFQQIPVSFEEAARMDGAGDFAILFRVFIPLSKPALATIALWTAVLHWNSWFDGLIYVTSDSKQVLQVFLQRIVVENVMKEMKFGTADLTADDFSSEAVRAATVVVTVLPILAAYPFMQRYFMKGIMLGGTKE